MKITSLTITGIDDATNPYSLIISELNNSFIEWGVLFSDKREGTSRYPSKSAINYFVKTLDRLSAHFCGNYAKRVLENGEFSLIDNLHSKFKRVQLNYNFKNNSNYNLENLAKYAMDNPDRSIILQFNKSNADALREFIADGIPANIHFLHDASGGRGIEIKTIPATVSSTYNGFAGGLNPNNIESICNLISSDAEDVEVWIDLESGVRTDDKFDTKKLTDILVDVKKIIK